MSKSYRKEGRIAMVKETSYRTIVSTKDAPATTVYAMDKKIDDAQAIGRTKLNRTRQSTIGSGQYHPDNIHEGAHDVKDMSFELATQVAKMLYAVCGGCVTTGTDTGESGTVTSGGGTTTLLLSGGGAFTINEFAGFMLTITGGDNNGNKYHIVSNDADEVTLDKAPPANIDGDNYRIDGPPFTHTISVSRPLPSFCFHFEQENATDAQSIRKDLLGSIVNTLTYSIDASATDNFITQTADVIGARSVTGNDLARPTELDDIDELIFCSIVTNTLTYNSVNYMDTVVTLTLEITNNAELEHVVGSTAQCWADNVKEGVFDITLSVTLKPSTKVLYDLQETKIPDFLTDLAWVFKASSVADSYPTAKTDTVASGGGTAVLTVTGGGLTIDAHIGDWLVVTSGDNLDQHFYITDNTADTITLDRVTPSSIDGDGIEIKYPHSIAITIDKMYIDDDNDAEIPSADEQQFGVEYTLFPTGAASFTPVAVDGFGIAHYEGSS